MRNYWLGTIALPLALSACCTPPNDISSLDVAVRGQQTSMWCWAASGEMVMEFLGTSIDQCDEANKRFGRSDCCNSPVPNACVNGGWPEFDKYGFTAKTTADTALTWAQVKEQVFCRKAPFAYSWHWSGGGGHMMVGKGYVVIDGVNYVSTINPLPVNQGNREIMTYDAFVSGAGYTHWNDYYDITKK